MGFFDTPFSRRYIEAFSDVEIERHLGFNTEHPPLAKFTFGVTHRISTIGWASLRTRRAFARAAFSLNRAGLHGDILPGRALVSAR